MIFNHPSWKIDTAFLPQGFGPELTGGSSLGGGNIPEDFRGADLSAAPIDIYLTGRPRWNAIFLALFIFPMVVIAIISSSFRFLKSACTCDSQDYFDIGNATNATISEATALIGNQRRNRRQRNNSSNNNNINSNTSENMVSTSSINAANYVNSDHTRNSESVAQVEVNIPSSPRPMYSSPSPARRRFQISSANITENTSPTHNSYTPINSTPLPAEATGLFSPSFFSSFTSGLSQRFSNILSTPVAVPVYTPYQNRFQNNPTP